MTVDERVQNRTDTVASRGFAAGGPVAAFPVPLNVEVGRVVDDTGIATQVWSDAAFAVVAPGGAFVLSRIIKRLAEQLTRTAETMSVAQVVSG